MRFAFKILFFLTLIISCTNQTTEYNSYFKNSTSSKITVKLVGSNLLTDSLDIEAGATEKVYTSSEDGDFEIYDCTLFFDSIFVDAVYIVKDSLNITTTNIEASNKKRIHDCTFEFK